MKKIVALLLTIVLLSACSLSNSPKSKVKAFLNGYNSLSDEVVADLETKAGAENLSEENKKVYMDVLRRQYKDMAYEIISENIDEDKATVKVKITVYDLYKIDKDTVNYVNNHYDEFIDENGVYSENMFNTYKLDKMIKTTDKISYEVDFYLNKVNDEWIIESPDRVSLEKIHGLYNYDE